MRPGDVLAGRYVLKQVVGAGRSGEVWLAHDTVVGQDVALKPEGVEGDRETTVRRLLGEPRAMARFRGHPHVVTLYDVLSVPLEGDRTAYWFVMEYVPGGGLDRREPMSPERAARIGAELADALTALHEAGIVHCDVKPANIGLTRHGAAKLLDFGAAYRTGGIETVTANGPLSFTPAYAAPELARGNVPRPASDVYCLAATLHALVADSPPRDGGPGRGGPDGEGGWDGEGGPERWGGPGEAVGSSGGNGSSGSGTRRLTYWKTDQGLVEVDAAAVGPLAPVLRAMLRRDPAQRPDAAEAGRLLAAVAGSGGRPPLGTAARGAETVQDEDPRDRAPRMEILHGGGRPDGVSRFRPRRRRAVLAAAVGATAVLALTLASVVLLGDGGDASDKAPRSVIGDPRTADVCALVDLAALRHYGEVQVDVDYGNFDRCEVMITKDESRIDLSVSLLKGPPPEMSQPSRRIGRIGVLEEPQKDDECARLLTEDDQGDILVGVRANIRRGPVTGGTSTLCLVADAAVQSAAETLDKGNLPRRVRAYPKNSLAWKDACELLDTAALSKSGIPGLAQDRPKVGVANWSCEWAGNTDGLKANVAFFRDQPRSAADSDHLTRLSGYRAVIVEEGNEENTCTVFVEYREYSGESVEPAAEMVRLWVGGRRPMGELCGMARKLAGSAAAALPEP